MSTKISWCDETINPIVGCSKISAGCQNCYAENMARRLAAMGLKQYMAVNSVDVSTGKAVWGGWNGETHFVPTELDKPYKWKKSKSIFIGSMGDVFHKSVPTEWHNAIMNMAYDCPQHTFILLTKRPQRMLSYLSHFLEVCGSTAPNMAVGVSVEDQKTADERIPLLLQTPAAKRFISLEPMIGPVDLEQIEYSNNCACNWCGGFLGVGHDCYDPSIPDEIHGVIVGGESGAKARPFDPAWVRLVRDQCAAADVSFMFKQWGDNVLQENGRPYEYITNNGFPLLDGISHTATAWDIKKLQILAEETP